LLEKTSISIEDRDFNFENTPVTIIVNRNCPEIKLAGLKIGPLEEGKEYELRFWIAKELENTGIARFREETLLERVRLHKIHWKESVQSARQVSSLPENFYPKLRRYLSKLRDEARKNADKLKEYERGKQLSRDIVNCRLKKIVSLSSMSTRTNQILENLTNEERAVYEQLYQAISRWRTKILKGGA
jgi:hypothetical protein